jgi:hypothetical protein
MPKRQQTKLRSHVPATGSFVSFPDAFRRADDAVKYAPKIAFQVAGFKDSKRPLHLEPVLDRHIILFDLQAVDAEEFDPRQIVRDCELLKRAAEAYPEKLKTILGAFATDAPRARVLEAAKIAADLDLSEERSSKAGGGFVALVVLGAALVLSGCLVDPMGDMEDAELAPDLTGIPPSPEEPD